MTGTLQLSEHTLQLRGDFVHADVARLLPTVRAAVGNARQVDLSGVGQVDSSVLSLLLALQREAQAQNRPLAFSGWPQNLLGLARLYGIRELF